MYAFSYWQAVYRQLREQSQRVKNLLSDQRIAEAHMQTHFRVWHRDTLTSSRFDELTEDKKTEVIRSEFVRNGQALATYNDQLCVLVYSYVEATIKDFYKAVFTRFPDKMNNYIRDEYVTASNGNGALDLYKRVVKAASREEFIEAMARIAAVRAVSSSDPKKRLQRVADAVKADKEEKDYLLLNEALGELVEHRNQLVHEPMWDFASEAVTRREGDQDVFIGMRAAIPANKLSPDDVLETYHRLYIYLCNLCLANDVPVFDVEPDASRYLYVSPTEDFELLVKQVGLDSATDWRDRSIHWQIE